MKRIPYGEIQRYNPVRPVDWRWQRAAQLVETPKGRSSCLDDPETLTAVDFIKALKHCHTEEEHRQLDAQKAAIALSHAIHTGEPARRIEIQARLLAGQTSAEIGELLGLSVASIEMYESVFYNVRDRLEAELYILGAAIGWGVLRPSHDGMNSETILKTVAYFGGPLVVDATRPLLFTKTPITERDHGTSAEDGAKARQQAEMLIAVMQHPLIGDSAIRMALLQRLLDRTCPRPCATDVAPKKAGVLVDCGDFLGVPSVPAAAPLSPPAESSESIACRSVA